MNRWDIVNAVGDVIDAKTYLEIGVRWGCNIQRIRVGAKLGVDPQPQPPIETGAEHCQMTSDEFFSSDEYSDRSFDLVFIDGLHHAEQVQKDVLHALGRLNPGGAIVLHDCSPPNERSAQREVCAGEWCGDVWKAWVKLRQGLEREMFVVNEDLGCGVILYDRAEPLPPVGVPLEWGFLQKNRTEWLNLKSWRWYTDRLRQLQEARCI